MDKKSREAPRALRGKELRETIVYTSRVVRVILAHGAMLIFSVSFQASRMIPEGNPELLLALALHHIDLNPVPLVCRVRQAKALVGCFLRSRLWSSLSTVAIWAQGIRRIAVAAHAFLCM